MSDQAVATVVVDGATGYVGSHLVARLRAQNVQVRCLVHEHARSTDVEFLRLLGAIRLPKVKRKHSD